MGEHEVWKPIPEHPDEDDVDKTCRTCRYGALDDLDDRVCVNRDSEHCADWVGDDDACECWEEPVLEVGKEEK